MKERPPVRLFLFVVVLSVAGYLARSSMMYGLGFPLDDAWIHQTYARNLVVLGEWSFVPGQVSAGSTAPLWSAVLAIGYVLRLSPLVWANVLGGAALLGLAVVGWWGARILLPHKPEMAKWTGIALALEWHMVWAAASGMETLAFSLLVTAVLVWLASARVNWWGIGLLVGVGVWLRPDAITLLGPLLWGAWFIPAELGQKLRRMVQTCVGVLAGFLPYLLFNWFTAGDVWPNTFFAKQAEYQILTEAPFLMRFVTLLGVPQVGVGVVLLPGVVYLLVQSFRERRWVVLGGVIWWVGYVGIFAARLPVTYQHGRYLMPVIPIFVLWGLVGFGRWARPSSRQLFARVLSRVWGILIPIVLLAFWGMGGQAFARDVAVIESEMVLTAKWVATNTPEEAVIAAHDIGALGYFAERDLLDLAGLVSPDVIPFIRDETLLADYLDDFGADYLVTLRDWYPELERGLHVEFVTQQPYSPALGGENMVVYRWK